MTINKITRNNMVFSVLELLIGLILLFRPNGFTSLIIITLGCIFLASGVLSTVNYFRTDHFEAMSGNLLSKGLLFLIIGMFFIFNNKWFIVTFPVTTVLYGVFMLLMGVVKFQGSIDCLRCKVKYWYINLIGAIITLVAAVLIIANPFASAEFMWRFIATAMLVEAVTDIIFFIISYKKAVKSC